MKNFNEFIESFLKEDEYKQLLKDLILQKYAEYEPLLVRQNVFWSEKYRSSLQAKVRPEFLSELLTMLEEKREIDFIERDLNSMSFYLKQSSSSKPIESRWIEQYEYATRIVAIDRVVGFLLGIDRFNRNIKCPFHDDGKSSLKVYVKNNRFYCFGCCIRGSPIDFVMQYKNCSFREAVLFLSNL